MNRLPCTYMRAGTSRGPFLDLRDLPADEAGRAAVLLKIMGSPHPLQVDGLGGATPTTSKVVMVQPSERPGIDVDYLFAQVEISRPLVDFRPTCGNVMTGVGPFAIEKGWVEAKDKETEVAIFNINTQSITKACVQTPGGQVNYTDGDFAIDGVPGTAAPILMNLYDIAGGTTGALFPTGRRTDVIGSLDVSIVDAGNLMMLLNASQLGLDGTEKHGFFEENGALRERLERIRQKAGRLAGLGDVSKSVLPRFSLLSAPRKGGTIMSQYFTPHTMHPTHAVSGAICIAVACCAKGTVATALADNATGLDRVMIEHVAGQLPIEIEVEGADDDFQVRRVGTWRTARKIMDGFVYY